MWRKVLGIGRRHAVAVPKPADGESDRAYLERLARAHLPDDIADRWLALLRPAIRLTAASNGDPVVASLGGQPRLPDDLVWPEWDGHGPLSYIGEVDLEALARLGLDAGIPLPTAGRLVFFYFDGSYDNFEGIVGTWDTASLAGARMLYVEDGQAAQARQAPERVPVFDERPLTARQIMTAPNWEHPALNRAFGIAEDDDSWVEHPVNAEAFIEAVWERHDEDEPCHQLGGWADPDQGPVEREVAQAALDLGEVYDDPRIDGEADRWTLLLQVDSDGEDMMWGDLGKLYWLARHDDLDAGNLTEVSFTWQCG